MVLREREIVRMTPRLLLARTGAVLTNTLETDLENGICQSVGIDLSQGDCPEGMHGVSPPLYLLPLSVLCSSGFSGGPW